MRTILCWLALFGLALVSGDGAARAAGARSAVDPALQRALDAAGPGNIFRIEVVLAGGDSLPPPGGERRARVTALQDAVLARLPGGSFELVRRYRAIAALAGRANRAGIAALAAAPGVAAVNLDGRVRAQLAEGSALIGATIVHSQGYTGAGVRVAVLDTGIDTNHPDLAGDIAAQHCFCSGTLLFGCCPNGSAEDTSAEDDEGHGTSVAGIITSAGAQAPLGVAPDAKIIAVKVLDSGGGGNFSDVAAGLDWVLDESGPGGAAAGVRIVTMSLGDGTEYTSRSTSPCSGSATANAIAALHAAGIAVFAASGNDGFDAGIAFPACVAGAISVGGVYDAAVGSVSWCGEDPLCLTALCTDNPTDVDRFVCHTNSGPLLDVLAPDYKTTTSKMGGGVEPAFGGTSAACPYAAAEAALLVQARPSLTPDQIRSALVASGPLVTNPDSGLSFPRADVEQAFLPEPEFPLAAASGVALVAWLAGRRRHMHGF
jgi:subtilisin family serine protease